VLAPEHLLELRALHRRLEGVERGAEVTVDVLAGGGPLREHPRVVLLGPEPLEQLEVALDALASLQELL